MHVIVQLLHLQHTIMKNYSKSASERGRHVQKLHVGCMPEEDFPF